MNCYGYCVLLEFAAIGVSCRCAWDEVALGLYTVETECTSGLFFFYYFLLTMVTMVLRTQTKSTPSKHDNHTTSHTPLGLGLLLIIARSDASAHDDWGILRDCCIVSSSARG